MLVFMEMNNLRHRQLAMEPPEPRRLITPPGTVRRRVFEEKRRFVWRY
ncbi:MAG: hypothetical protein AVDCRST_MAG86-3322 [uncultured Truepera sp.]|uniref:Uncharacterized protein n=1 Tax=uncultured Truepera sp. TaxID=543023 RepID=A0A6J4VTN3_9DEIN|nr:MAG: hypothetical protein AVDCRST_MAG86-3322 [uncultured Truepera sp.]